MIFLKQAQMKNDNNFKIVRFFILIFVILNSMTATLNAQNLVTNPGFEDDLTGWIKSGDSTLSTSTLSLSGNYSALLSNRTQSWNGINQSMLDVMKDTKTYKISGWVRLQNAYSDEVAITVMQTDSNGTNFFSIYNATAFDDQWILLSGKFTLNVIGELTSLNVYVEGPAAGVDLYLDDVVIEEFNWRTEVNAKIDQIRKRDVQITVLSPQGQPLPNIDVKIRQIKHRFGFGSSIDRTVLTNDNYANFFKHNFQWATPDSDLKWYVNEPDQGQVDYTGANAIYDYCNDNNIAMRGHTIFWAREAFVPDWVKDLSTLEMQDAVSNRLNSAVSEFKDKCVHWEINNEMLYGSFFKDNIVSIDDVPVRVWMFQQTHNIDPNAMLFVNEYATIAFGVKLDEYKNMVTNLLQAGAPIHGVGVQCHVDSNYNRGLFMTRFERMAELNLPIWVTEFDVDQPDDVYRARDLEDLYRICFGLPAVEGIILFGFWEQTHWRPNGHIVNTDWSLNEAGYRYHTLLDEWTTKLDSVTNENGIVDFRGFHGTYEVILGQNDAFAITKTIDLLPGERGIEFVFQLDIDVSDVLLQKQMTFSETLPDSLEVLEEELNGQICGIKWKDLHGYGRYDPNYPNLSNITIFLDLNENEQFDANEPSSITNEDGEYIFQDLEPGTYKVSEIVPAGWRQSYPTDKGSLFFIETLRDGQGLIAGLDSVSSVTISPDGNTVYSASVFDDALTVFSRDQTTGLLTFVEVIKNGLYGIKRLDGVCAAAVSPDGKNLYTASAHDDSLVVFNRNQTTGQLAFVELLTNDPNSVKGLNSPQSLIVSPDGNYVYVAGTYDDALGVFKRDTTTGQLTFIEALEDGLDGVEGLYGICSIAVSPDSKHVYTVGAYDNALTHFERDADTGHLNFTEFWQDDHNDVDGLRGAHSITISSDGNNVYVASIYDNAVASFARNQVTGRLSFMAMLQDGVNDVDGLTGAYSVGLSTDGKYLFVAGKYDDALAVFERNVTTGQLTFIEAVKDGQVGVEGLDGASSIVVSPDGRHIYVASTYGDSITVLGSSQGPHFINVNSGQTVENINFGNYKEQQKIFGKTWEDLDADGIWDSSEPVLEGVVIYLDLNENGQMDIDEPNTITDDQGEYVFHDLKAGTYKVAQIIPTGQYTWHHSFPPIEQDDLSFVQILNDGQDNIEGLCGVYSVALSPNGDYVYAVSVCGSALTVFSREEGSGQLTFLQVLSDNEDLVNGLGGAHDVTVSPDGKHIYVAGTYDNAIAIFEYNEIKRQVTFVGQILDGEDGVDGLMGVFSVAVSTDGKYVYAAGTLENALSVFSRDQATGQLTFIEVLKDGENGVQGLFAIHAIELSPDDNNVYAAGTFDNSISVFNRDKTTGFLTFTQVLENGTNDIDGLGSVVSLVVSPDGNNLYAVGAGDDAVAVFARNITSGQLTFLEVFKNNENGIEGLDGASSVTASQDGSYIYVTGTYDNALAVFSRNKDTGRLTFLNCFTDSQIGDDRLASISSVAISPDGNHLYIAASSHNSLAVLKQGNHLVEIVQGKIVDGINFGSYEDPREIHGAVWEDLDADGFWNNGEPFLIGATVFLDLNENTWLDVNEPSTTTDPQGEYMFTKLDPKEYSVAMVAPYGSPAWIRSFPPKNGELAFIEVLNSGYGNTEGLNGVQSLIVSPEGKNVYAVGNADDSIVVFERDQATGRLNFVEALYDGQSGIEGLGGVSFLTISSDGKHIYAAGSDDDALVVFDRDQETGCLSIAEVLREGLDSVDGLRGVRSIALSLDGEYVYAAGTLEDALVVFSRDTITGKLVFVQAVKNGQDSIEGLVGVKSVVVSPDDNHVYAASVYSDSLTVFNRDINTGQLTFAQIIENNKDGATGLDGVCSIAISNDGNHIYAVSNIDNTLTIFRRSQMTGQLTFTEVLWNSRGGIKGLDGAASVAISPDGNNIYVAGSENNTLAVFSRDQIAGRLTLMDVLQDNKGTIDGLASVQAVTISNDAQHIYTASSSENAIAVFKRGPYRQNVNVGQVLRHVNFAYYEPGEISGSTWNDIDADGIWDTNEIALAGVEIYLDTNKNGQLDAMDILTVTDEFGEYMLGGLAPDTHKVAEIVPDGWKQSFPANGSNLEFVEAVQDQQGQVDGLAGIFSVVVSPQGNHIYTASMYDDAITVLTNAPSTGYLQFIQTVKNGRDGINGLDNVHSLILSPDGNFIYAAGTGEDALVVFSRNPDTGSLSFVQTVKNGNNSVEGLHGVFSSAVSPDGKHLYAAGTYGDTLAVFSRDINTGRLTFIEALKDDQGDINGLNSVRSVSVSPDGKHVYAAGTYDNALAIFSRNSNSGELTFVDAIIDDQNSIDGLNAVTFLTVSQDGHHVYAAGSQDNAIAVFSRDVTTGYLNFIEAIKNGQDQVHGLRGVCAIIISPDGNRVYAASWADDTLVKFTRDKNTGMLTFDEALVDGQQSENLDSVVSIAISPNGKYLYAAAAFDNALTMFKMAGPQYVDIGLGEKVESIDFGIYEP